MSAIKSYQVQRVTQNDVQVWQSNQSEDAVVVEEPLEIWITILAPQQTGVVESVKGPFVTMMRTPGDDIHLATGWLLSSGLIDSVQQIVSIHHSGAARLKGQSSNQLQVTLSYVSRPDLRDFQRQEVANSACGVCGQQSIESLLHVLEQKTNTPAPAVKPIAIKAVSELVLDISARQAVFKQTGGNHGVALFNQNLAILDVREDVGRHNAFDKVIGANAASLFCQYSDNKLIDFAALPCGVILSGRVGFEMIQKALMANLSFVLALGAPSSLALELAREADIALVGFIKPQRFNIYSGQHKFRF